MSEASLEWLITAYSLTFGGLLLFGGRTGDLFGKRRMFMAGIAIFATASLLGGLATGPLWLVITRGLPGGWRRRRLAHRPLADRHQLPRGPGAQPGHGRLCRHVGRRRRRGAAAGRDPDPGGLVAVDLLHQRADRRPGALPHPAGPQRVHHLVAPPRRARRYHRHRRHAAGGLRHLQQFDPRLGQPRHRAPPDPGRRPAGQLRVHRGAHDRRPHAAVDLRQPQPLGRLRPHAVRGHGHVLDVLLPLPVPPEDPGLDTDQDRGGLPADDGGHRHLGRRSPRAWSAGSASASPCWWARPPPPSGCS